MHYTKTPQTPAAPLPANVPPPPATPPTSASASEGSLSLPLQIGLSAGLFMVGLASMFVVQGVSPLELLERDGSPDFAPSAQRDQLDVRDPGALRKALDNATDAIGHDEVLKVTLTGTGVTVLSAVEPGATEFHDVSCPVDSDCETDPIVSPVEAQEDQQSFTTADLNVQGVVQAVKLADDRTVVDTPAEAGSVVVNVSRPYQGFRDVDFWITVSMHNRTDHESFEFALRGDDVSERDESFDYTNPEETQQILDELIAQAGTDEVSQVEIGDGDVFAAFAVEPGGDLFVRHRYNEFLGYQQDEADRAEDIWDSREPFNLGDVDPAVIPQILDTLEEDTSQTPELRYAAELDEHNSGVAAPIFTIENTWVDPRQDDPRQIHIRVNYQSAGSGRQFALYTLDGEFLMIRSQLFDEESPTTAP